MREIIFVIEVIAGYQSKFVSASNQMMRRDVYQKMWSSDGFKVSVGRMFLMCEKQKIRMPIETNDNIFEQQKSFFPCSQNRNKGFALMSRRRHLQS
jgi:hypothetical protein